MREMPSKRSSLLIISLTCGVVILLFYNFDKSHSLVIDSILGFGHVPLFCVVTAMILWIIDWKNWPVSTTRNYILAGVISGALAVLTEALQQLTPERSFQIGDIIHDLMGSTIFILIAYQYKRKLKRKVLLSMNIMVAALLLFASLPVLATVLDELRSKSDFPLLASFEMKGEMKRWKIDEINDRSHLHATQGKHSLRIELTPGLYPGASFNHPPRDWRGYDTLKFDALLEGEYPLSLTVRINDLRHNEEFSDRYNRTFTLRPGPNHVAISLSEVEHAPKGRLMDMEHIAVLCIFSYKLKEPRTVYFDNFRLEKNG